MLPDFSKIGDALKSALSALQKQNKKKIRANLAGHIASACVRRSDTGFKKGAATDPMLLDEISQVSVKLADKIIKELKATEPEES